MISRWFIHSNSSLLLAFRADSFFRIPGHSFQFYISHGLWLSIPRRDLLFRCSVLGLSTLFHWYERKRFLCFFSFCFLKLISASAFSHFLFLFIYLNSSLFFSIINMYSFIYNSNILNDGSFFKTRINKYFLLYK
jgi:hypothetical protein